MKKERFDAITDAIMAIIITLMLIEIKIPELSIDHLLNILYQVLVYAISFITIAIVWLNHHRFVNAAGTEKIGIRSVWVNFGMLFMISFLPVATAHLSNSFFKIENHIFYASVAGLMVMFYAILQDQITKSKKEYKRDRKMSWISAIFYFLAIPSSFLSVYLSGAIFILIPLLYFFQTNKQ
ncbi:TMEM175 family protein [Flavobacterium sp.]|uniref:TMEM175 family protein n=1 Tax=Flavobacterium sp. TaxID=239 RepID=UPI00261F3DDB|nr:TMEM175 family protein [Flavobacterium sp.]